MKWVFFLAILASCGMGSKAINIDTFAAIVPGTSKDQVVAALGRPSAVRNKKGGYAEYEYMERAELDGWGYEEHRYYLLMQDDLVVSKNIEKDLFVRTWQWKGTPR